MSDDLPQLAPTEGQIDQANAHPEVFAGKTVGQVADHYRAVVGKLEKKPAVVGHSFGGLLARILAGRSHSFANAAGEGEAKLLYETYAVPAAGAPLF